MKKKNHAKSLKQKLWRIFSEYVRTRDKGTCITCGRYATGSGYHAGHFIPSAVGGLALRYDERNVHGQCYHCNINLGGWGERYAEVLEGRFGREYVDELRRLQHTTVFDFDYEAKIKEFEEKTKKLKQCPDQG